MANKKAIILSKIEAIKKINDRKKDPVENVFDLVRDDLPSIDGSIRRRIDDFQSKYKSKRTTKRDLFSEVISIAESFINGSGESKNNVKPEYANKLREYGKDAALVTINASKKIVTDVIKSELFSGKGVCGNNNKFTSDTIDISPKEFDFLSMLKASPSSTFGKIVYEDEVDHGFIKMNRKFYETFGTLTYDFITNKGETLFTITWDKTIQKYRISGLLNIDKISDFISKYYDNIEYSNLDSVLKNTMYLTIYGDGSEPKTVTISMDWLNRLAQKIFALCGNKFNPKPFNQNPANQVDEDIDIEEYFNFEDTEGINLEDEKNRLDRVLKFTDCDNFENEVDENHIKDFIYFYSKGRNSDENINDTLNKVIQETYEKSYKTIPPINLQTSITLKYLLNLPRAILATVLSPKIFFPVITVYKAVNNITGELTVLQFMKKMAKIFYKIVTKIFWRFLREFWRLIKKELLNFLKAIVIRIVKNSLKRYKLILSSLILFLSKVLTTNWSDCNSLYDSIIGTIDNALQSTMNIPIPGVMLAYADSAPGYSTDRAYMNIVEKLTASGIPMGDLYGRSNDLHAIIKSIVEGNSEEIDKNSFIKISLKPTVVPITPAGAIITPVVVGSGKLM